MAGLFLLPSAVRHEPAIDAWLDSRPAALGALARTWFMQMRGRGPEVRELVHDGCPVACVGDAAFGYVNAFTAHVNVGFFHGADLDDPAQLLQGNGRQLRHVKLRPGADVDTAALGRLIGDAYADVKWRLAQASGEA
jgi:hypothetical protein